MIQIMFDTSADGWCYNWELWRESNALKMFIFTSDFDFNISLFLMINDEFCWHVFECVDSRNWEEYLKLITFDNNGVGIKSVCESRRMKFNTKKNKNKNNNKLNSKGKYRNEGIKPPVSPALQKGQTIISN